ncbi:hypothetical protein Tco_1108022 [Tanacetum coccineum]
MFVRNTQQFLELEYRKDMKHFVVPGTGQGRSKKKVIERETIIGIPVKTHNAQVDDRDMDNGWGIMVMDVERLGQMLTPTVYTLPNLEPVVQLYMPIDPVRDEAKVEKEEERDYDIPLQDGMMQLLTLQTVHITPPDDDYVAPATNPILDKHLNEFGEEFFDMIEVDEKADVNYIQDTNELSIKTNVELETFIQKLLNRVS